MFLAAKGKLNENLVRGKGTETRTNCLKPIQQLINAGEISVKEAIAKNKGAVGKVAAKPRKSKAKRTKEVKLSVGGYTITVKARKLLTDPLVLEALRQAIDQLEPVSSARKLAA